MTITDFVSNAPIAKVIVVFVLYPLLMLMIGAMLPRSKDPQ